MERNHSGAAKSANFGDDCALTDEGDRLIRKLESMVPLSLEDREAVLKLRMRTKSYAADQDVVREGDRMTECSLVLHGFVFRYKNVADGRRQIMSFHPPPDIPDLQSLYLETMDHSIATLVPTKMAFIAHRAMHQLMQSRPAIARALWRDLLIQGAIFREWMVGLGRRSAYQRLAHLLCETAVRLEIVGLGTAERFDFPVTQTELADALGMSTVHANRVVQELRRTGFVRWQGSSVTILDWQGLQEAGEFEPAYLQREQVPL